MRCLYDIAAMTAHRQNQKNKLIELRKGVGQRRRYIFQTIYLRTPIRLQDAGLKWTIFDDDLRFSDEQLSVMLYNRCVSASRSQIEHGQNEEVNGHFTQGPIYVSGSMLEFAQE